MGKARYEISLREPNKRYLVRLFDGGGTLLLTSQYREQLPMCKNEITWMRTAAMKDNLYERIDDEGGKWYFILHANDAHILGVSPFFESELARERGISAVKGAASGAELVDTTPAIDLTPDIHGFLHDLGRAAAAQAQAGDAPS